MAQPIYCTSKNSHFTRAEKELANTLVATDYKDPPVINDVQTASGKEVFGTLSASMGSKQWLGYPAGTRVELVRMIDEQAPPIGTKGTVTGVDDTASVMVAWDNGSHLHVIYGEDEVRKEK